MATLGQSQAALLLFFVMLISAGCAKTGDPHPPRLLIPKPATDLAARQKADKIILSVSMPVENTDGSPVTTLAEVELFRLLDKKQDNPAPLAEEEFLERAHRALVIPAEKLENFRQDKTLAFQDDLAIKDRSAIFNQGVRYAVRFINRKNQTGGLSNQVYVAPIPIPNAPTNLSSHAGQEFIRLHWTPPAQNLDQSRPARIIGYNVYRTEDPQGLTTIPLNKELLREPEFEDRSFQFDKTYYYAVSVVGSLENPYAESLPSPPLIVLAQDTFAPGPPQLLNALVEKGVVILLWAAPPETDVEGYRVYRREDGTADTHLLSADLITTLSYRDDKVQSGKKYEYRVTTVDTHGNESPAALAPAELP